MGRRDQGSKAWGRGRDQEELLMQLKLGNFQFIKQIMTQTNWIRPRTGGSLKLKVYNSLTRQKVFITDYCFSNFCGTGNGALGPLPATNLFTPMSKGRFSPKMAIKAEN
jgi:hypothetical protein